jgi:anti-sigma B factor antagonist
MWYNSGVDLLSTSVTLVESASDSFTLVALAGEADVTNSAMLWDVLEAEVTKEPRTVVIDLGEVRFMDSSALHVILRANRMMARHGGVLALARPQETVARILSLTAADQLVPVYGSVADAAAG